MKQVLLRKGSISLENVPAPAMDSTSILVEVSRSLISTGTELASYQLSQASLIEKARKKPEEIPKVIQSIRVRGILRTYELVREKLDESRPLGYSCSGQVIAVGQNVKNFQKGDRVACAGAGQANHAEIVSIPENLAVKIPASVSDTDASFVTLGAIALQGVRRSEAKLGETVCVVGLGLIGQITVQILKAAGCRVFGFDPDASRVEAGLKMGLRIGTTDVGHFQSEIDIATAGMGVDATILTASTEKSDPANMAFGITRKKGKVVVVGAVGMDLKRSPFYEKEQDFLISCSYGPGRYDPSYEQKGIDYPYAFVRWTENRNMAAFIDLIAEKKINTGSLVERTFSIDKAPEAYELLNQDGPKPLAIVLEYPKHTPVSYSQSLVTSKPKPQSGAIGIGMIGLGNFAKSTHLPSLRNLGKAVKISGICTLNSATAASGARQLGCDLATTNYQDLLASPDIDAVIISTRHRDHALIAEQAIRANKHVYLEKPMALSTAEIDKIKTALASEKSAPVFMVGFNRRFAPHTLAIKKFFERRQSPLIALYRVNAGMLPTNHWSLSQDEGGRLRGEACHMVDFFRAVIGKPLTEVSIINTNKTTPRIRPDENFSAQFSYEDGSIATLIYSSLGDSRVPKEWIEISADGKTVSCDDFRDLRFGGKKNAVLPGAQNKGHLNSLSEFIQAINERRPFPISWEELEETTRVCIELDAEVWGKLSDSQIR